jgi:hypothetical protein
LPNRRGFAGLLVLRDQVRGIIEASNPPPSEKFTVQAAAAQLGVKEQVVYELMRNGLMGFTEHRLQHRLVHLIDAVDLHEFLMRYVSLAALARQRDMSPRIVLQQLEHSGIRPVTGPLIDGARQYFFKKGDLQRALQMSLD